ncbi:ROK family transcriptional regulator [Enterococcus asini]|uniref:ROK family transcriptional regulator n=1 Tax=Enterococcus asini TaxID=57732 RepID=UPI001E2E0F64|nr:ROK family transcriptional regulator [Enterococcus asini]MCD5029641.1 ROK family transcriptional regulator [Enterococcus asini]
MTLLAYSPRTANETLCLEYIMNQQNLSRADLATLTGLTKATVSGIVKKLIEDQLVIETGIGESSNVGGRKPINLQFNGQAGLSIAIDVGYNYVNGLLSYLDGEEIAMIQEKPIPLNEDTIQTYFQEIFNTFSKVAPETVYGVVGVVIAVHGPVFHGDILFTPHYNLDQIPFRQIAESLTDYPVYFENEANLSALGEYSFTSTSSSLICVNMHSGIGAGIVQNGHLQVGSHGVAGEIGHQIVVLDGTPCRCGNHGCLEMYAANKVCFEHFATIKAMEYVNAIILREYYRNQDADALAVVAENVRYLSIGINNLIAHYDPEVIVLNSSLYREIPEMIVLLQDSLHSHFAKKVILRNSHLQEKATLLGGLVLNLQHFLAIEQVRFTETNS